MSLAKWIRETRNLDWPRFSIKFIPFFLAYGIGAGLLVTGGVIGMLGGVLGALVVGYLAPRDVDIFSRGPVITQIGNGVSGALLGSFLAGFVGL